jgi:hypothetical protein
LLIEFKVGTGFTVIENVTDVPGQPFAVGVAITIPVNVLFPEFNPVNELKSPIPLAAKPIPVWVLVQFTAVLFAEDEKITPFTFCPTQSVWLGTVAKIGTGFTVIEKVIGVPVQPFALGVAITVPVNGELVVFVPVNELMLVVVPLAAKPIPVSLFIQLIVVPLTFDEYVIPFTVCPAQTVWFVIADSEGIGFTVIEKLTGAPVQPFALGVAVT